MKVWLVAGLALALPFAAAPAVGTHGCEEDVYGGGAVYLVLGHFADGEKFVWSVWGYVESNGVEGLQRGGITMLGDEDICQLSENPDQGVF